MIEDYLDSLFARVAKRIDRQPCELQPFMEKLRKNWYDTKEALTELKDQDFKKLQIPHRIVNAIRQQIGKGTHTTNNNQPEPQNNIEGAKRQKREPLNQDKMLQMARKLEKGVLTQCHNQGPKALEIFKTLQKIVGNIIKDSYDIKFRTLKRSNKIISQTIFQHPSCLQFMKQIGFVMDEQTLYLHVPETHQLCFIQQCLNQIIDRIIGSKTIARQQHKGEENSFPKMPQFPKDQAQLHKKFATNEMQNTNYVQSLDKLIQYRTKLMSQIPSNRKLRIYHKRHQQRQMNVPQYDLGQQLQKTDDSIIAQYWKQFINSNRKNTAFQSKRKLQFEFLLKQKIHKETCIKLKLPNELIIQGWFGPFETLNNVFGWVSQIVIGDLYLYTAPPVKVMKKELTMTLDALESVPTGSFFLGVNSQWYIKKEYADIIQK